MKAVVAAFNQERALVGAFSVIVQLHRLIDLRHSSAASAFNNGDHDMMVTVTKLRVMLVSLVMVI